MKLKIYLQYFLSICSILSLLGLPSFSNAMLRMRTKPQAVITQPTAIAQEQAILLTYTPIALDYLSFINLNKNKLIMHNHVMQNSLVTFINQSAECNALWQSRIGAENYCYLDTIIPDQFNTAVKYVTPVAIDLYNNGQIAQARNLFSTLDKALDFTKGVYYQIVDEARQDLRDMLANLTINSLGYLATDKIRKLAKIAVSLPCNIVRALYHTYYQTGEYYNYYKFFKKALAEEDYESLGRGTVKCGISAVQFKNIRKCFASFYRNFKIKSWRNTFALQLKSNIHNDHKSNKLKIKELGQIISVNNMKEFFNLDFGKKLKNFCEKTGQFYQGKAIYQIKEKIDHPHLKEGYYFYLDNIHRDHIEVFDKTGAGVTVLNLDGSLNRKSNKALTRKIEI